MSKVVSFTSQTTSLQPTLLAPEFRAAQPAQFTDDAHHVNGTHKPVTDVLSCVTVSANQHQSSTIDYESVAQAQQDDTLLNIITGANL